MEYKTHIFEKSKKRIRNNLIQNVAIIAGVVLSIFFWIIGIPGLGLLGGVSLGYYFYKMKEEESGISKYGRRKASLIISEYMFTIGMTEIPFTDIKNLVIYVDEYTGMPKDILMSYPGGNNMINFTHNTQKVSFNYLIPNKKDYRYVEQLVDKIEKSRVGQ